jgi:hypothetical protein
MPLAALTDLVEMWSGDTGRPIFSDSNGRFPQMTDVNPQPGAVDEQM